MRGVWLVAVAALVVTGCSRSRVSWSEILYAESQGNIDGTHSAVVHLSSGCSGTLVTSSHVLTAAHCVTEVSQPDVWLGTQGEHPDHRYSVASCYVHPLAYAAPIACGATPEGELRREYDLAILYLKEPIPQSLARPHSTMVASPIQMDDWLTTPVYLVGWHRWPQRSGPLRRYSGEQEVTYVNRVLVTEPDDDFRSFYTRRGNSGGPAILRAQGREIVVGVLSGGSTSGSLGPRFSLYAPTFSPTNSVWVRAHLEPQERPEEPEELLQMAGRQEPAVMPSGSVSLRTSTSRSEPARRGSRAALQP